MKSYTDLDIYKDSYSLALEVHKLSLRLPKYELYETGSQVRRSSKSITANIVEGYGRRRYKNDYIRFLTYSIASNDETVDHLETLFETESLRNKEIFHSIHSKLIHLGKKLNLFIQAVEKG